MKKLLLLIACCFLFGFTLNGLDSPTLFDGMSGFTSVDGMACGGLGTGCSAAKGSQDTASTGTTDLSYTTIYTHSGANCDVNYIELYADDYDSTAFKMAIWNDSTGPNAVIATTAAITSPAGWAWTGAALNTAITLVDGTTYYFGFRADNTIGYKYATASNAAYYSSGGSYATFPPDPWTATATTGRLIAIRVSYQ